jgi:hypothetical protein
VDVEFEEPGGNNFVCGLPHDVGGPGVVREGIEILVSSGDTKVAHSREIKELVRAQIDYDPSKRFRVVSDVGLRG